MISCSIFIIKSCVQIQKKKSFCRLKHLVVCNWTRAFVCRISLATPLMTCTERISFDGNFFLFSFVKDSLPFCCFFFFILFYSFDWKRPLSYHIYSLLFDLTGPKFSAKIKSKSIYCTSFAYI
jgi:hypothetical protein